MNYTLDNLDFKEKVILQKPSYERGYCNSSLRGGVKTFSATQGNIETFSTQTQLLLDQLLLEEYDSDNENLQKPL